MQEIYVIRDPEGNDTGDCGYTEIAAWYSSYLHYDGPNLETEHQYTARVKRLGYTCHPLHVYNPETQVVIGVDMFDFLCGWAPLGGLWFGEAPAGEPEFWWRKQLIKFIEANNPLVPIEEK